MSKSKSHKGCAVIYCKNSYNNLTEKKELSFFRFPRDAERYSVRRLSQK